MSKRIAFIIALFTSALADGQVIVNLQLPPMGLTIKSQLWNLSLINTGTGDINVQVEMTMTDVSNNQRVLTGLSKNFVLPRGVKQVQATDVMPIIYTVGAPGYNLDGNPAGFLPIGIFNICYTIIKINNDGAERLGEECQTIEIEPLSPPQLVIPHDSEHVETTRPFFTWLPPSPYNLFNNLQYDWILVEVQPTQNAASALQQNIPLLTQQYIPQTNFQYPLSSPELDSSKRYAWRVTAKNNLSPIAVSESWTFRVKKFGLDTAVRKAAGYYTKLKREEDASYIICTGVLRYEYLNEHKEDMLQFEILDIGSTKRIKENLDFDTASVKHGQNFIELDLGDIGDLKDKRIYLFQVTNSKNEKWYLKFEYRKPD